MACTTNGKDGERPEQNEASQFYGSRPKGYQDSRLEVQQVAQLPSPSPSPSPRSSSPSLLVSDSSVEYTGTLSSIPYGQRFPGSLEKVPNTSNRQDDVIISTSPSVIPKTLSSHELHGIPEEKVKKTRKLSMIKREGEILKLSAAEMEELTSAPESLPIISPTRPSISGPSSLAPSPIFDRRGSASDANPEVDSYPTQRRKMSAVEGSYLIPDNSGDQRSRFEVPPSSTSRRPGSSTRAFSSQPAPSVRMSSYIKAIAGQTSPKRKPLPPGARPEPLDINHAPNKLQDGINKSSGDPPSPIPQSIPLPPMSIPTYLQLELSSTRPSPLYIYRSAASEFPYESSRIKFERLLNFFKLAPRLEMVLDFGAIACLDAWLYTFTILPLRFFKALAVLSQWWGQALAREARFISGFIYHGTGRMWHRRRERRGSMDSSSRSRSVSQVRRPTASTAPSYQTQTGRHLDVDDPNVAIEHLKAEAGRKTRQGWGRRHRRTKSQPSSLSSYHKADLLQGAVIICSCMILMKLDASRMYHSIRGQAAIKLYVIYNVLEVLDKLLSAFGQDVLECLFSNETLERDTDGRSKIVRPLGMFVLALIYNVVHAAALFYQVIALNVAVNSYSNALLTLLLSNQFVEIKSTVFKKIEKDNLFQLTCADIVERFQLWLMLMIIALRNIVEVGGLNFLNGAVEGLSTSTPKSNSILPNSFTVLPSWTGEVLSPFVLVLGSEMVVDWIKHAYITKFNNVKPAIYSRYLDVLAKDYYTNVSTPLISFHFYHSTIPTYANVHRPS